ncbi:uncharacterized protein LOC131269688 [Anopheles coustani]|uniref:uncharacterized protein LOC131269688 n=1 Tax=Anopheles coustani TaxID=139045 RepID=UPI002658E5D5|nr:uncharacterized protein LOC131269688 [Anopheles coustani]
MNDMVTHNMSNSLATLCNIGNSCYMNSVLYTLRFAPNFTHNLHHLVEFLELVLQKTNGDRQQALQQKHGHNQPHSIQHKPKSSSLGRNIPGVHGSSGRSWSSKDLASLGSINGNDTAATGNNFPQPAAGGAGVSGISTFGPYNGIGNECSPAAAASGGNCINSSATGSAAGGSSTYRNVRDVEGAGSGGGGLKSNRHLVCETLHELFLNLARNETADVIEPFHAGGLLHAVQCVSATFEGNQQQDAHEFLMCILDSVRESCQTLNKNLLEHPDLLRNSSFSMVGPVAAPLDIVDANCVSHTASAPETKSSSAPFIARNLFRRRKESLKNAKSALAKEGRSITVDGAVTSLHPTTPNTPLDASLGEVASPLNASAAQKSGAHDERLLQDRIRALGLNFFCEDFEGVTVSRTRCLSCETVTEQKETMIDIAIPITSGEGNEAAKNPQQFYQDACITQEYFRGDNKYRCEVCSGYTEACRTISFDILPRLLVLQLKRFNGDMEKINSYIPTPFVLQCFCRDCLGRPEAEKRHVYRLYSVITHVGARMSVGHYIAYTSSLETPVQYFNCVKDRQRRVLLTATSLEAHQSANADGVSNGGSGSGGGSGGACGKGHNGSEKSTSGQLKKLFGGKKASSAGDISKKLKNNVINRFSPSNGIEALQLNGNLNTSTATPAGSGSGLPPLQLGTNEPLGSISGAAFNTPTANNFGSFPFNNNTNNNNGMNGAAGADNSGPGTAKLLHSGCPCPSIACCGLLAKNSASHSQYPPFPHTATGVGGSSGTANSGSLSDGGNVARLGNFHNASSLATGSIGALNANCSNHLTFHLGEMNGDGATPNLGPSSVAISNTHNRHVVNDLNHHQQQQQQQLMWYMCDDDKIKVMTQHEFEEMLSPNRRHVITPYLLFYARYDVQQQQQHHHQKLQQSQPKPSSKATAASSSSAGGGDALLPDSNSFNQFSPDGPLSSFIT